MEKKNIKWVSILLPLLLGIIIIYYQFSGLNDEQIEKIKYCFSNADYFYIYLSLFIALFGFWSRAYRWKFALNHLGYHSKFHNNFLTVCISYLVNLTIPRSGEISRAVLINKYEKIPFDKAFGTIVAERIVDLILFFLFATFGFILQFNTIYNFLLKKKVNLTWIIFLVILGITSLLLSYIFFKRSRWKIVLKIKEKLKGIEEGFFSVFQMKDKWWYIAHSIFIWATYLLMFYVTIFALKETSNISFDIVIMGFIFGSIAVGFTNGGIGAFPLSIALIFSLFGISNEIGTAFGWLVWTSQNFLIIILGLISYLILPFINKK